MENLKNLFNSAIEPIQAKLEESNIFGIGSQEDRDLRAKIAASDVEIKGCGRKVGLTIWRVENRRTEHDTPLFGIKAWPKSDYGSFYTGDSYIVLNTYKKPDSDVLLYDLHFWLGEESTQDERGVAAIKTVEIDSYLEDLPVQHRETQYNESKLFQSYFKEIIYMEGGIASGFRHVKPETYKPRLFMIRSSKTSTKAWQIPVKSSCMNHGDAFVLDIGKKVYTWIGADASPFERNKCGMLQSNIINSRYGKSKKSLLDNDFWETVGPESKIRETKDPYLPKKMRNEKKLERSSTKLIRVSDENEARRVEFTVEAEGDLSYEALDTNDVFIVVSNLGLFVWVGKGSTKQEKDQGMTYAEQYIKKHKLEKETTITLLREQNAFQNSLFGSLFSR